MNYQIFEPSAELKSFIKYYWTLEVPFAIDHQPQRIVPDGCIEMAFILGDDIKRLEPDGQSVIQPKAFVLGHTTEPFFIQPTGAVDSFAVKFYPFGFTNFSEISLSELSNKETALTELFEDAEDMQRAVAEAKTTIERIAILEAFLLSKLRNRTTIDTIVRNTIDILLSTRGSSSIANILKQDPSKRRQLERKFVKQIGISPKQLGRVIRMQTALRMILKEQNNKLTNIAYESEYYDQAHFIKDFREFTGINPGEFLADDQLQLSALFYSAD